MVWFAMVWFEKVQIIAHKWRAGPLYIPFVSEKSTNANANAWPVRDYVDVAFPDVNSTNPCRAPSICSHKFVAAGARRKHKMGLVNGRPTAEHWISRKIDLMDKTHSANRMDWRRLVVRLIDRLSCSTRWSGSSITPTSGRQQILAKKPKEWYSWNRVKVYGVTPLVPRGSCFQKWSLCVCEVWRRLSFLLLGWRGNGQKRLTPGGYDQARGRNCAHGNWYGVVAATIGQDLEQDSAIDLKLGDFW